MRVQPLAGGDPLIVYSYWTAGWEKEMRIDAAESADHAVFVDPSTAAAGVPAGDVATV